MIVTNLELAKIAIKYDQPMRAIDVYTQALKTHHYEPHFLTGIARVHDMLNDSLKSLECYKKVL